MEIESRRKNHFQRNSGVFDWINLDEIRILELMKNQRKDGEAQKVISCGISFSGDLSFSSKYTGEKNGNENPVGRRG